MSAPFDGSYMPPAAGMPNFPTDEVRHKIGPDVSTTTPTYQYDPQQALKDQDTQTAAAIAQTEESRKQAERQAQAQKEQADAEQRALEQQNAMRDAAIAKAQPTIDEWTTKLSAARQAYEKAPAPSLFADKDNAHKAIGAAALIGAAIADGFSAYGAVLSGHESKGAHFVNTIIANDLERQRENIKNLSDKAAMAKAGLQDADEAKKLLLADVDVKGAIMVKNAAAIAKAKMAAIGMAQPEIDQHKDILALQDIGLKYKEAAATHIQSQVDSKVTADEQVQRTETDASKSAHSTPTSYTDSLSGQSLPIDPTKTDRQAYNKAAGSLDKVNTLISAVDRIVDATKGGAEAPSWTAGVPFLSKLTGESAAKQALSESAMSQVRTAYGATFGEGTSQENQKALGASLPNPPAAPATDEAWKAWQSQITEMRNTALTYRANKLAMAGVPQQVITQANDYLNKAKNPLAPSTEAPAPLPNGNSMMDLGKPGHVPAGMRDLRDLPHDQTRNIRGMPEVQGAPSNPAGPALETPANSPDNPNSEAPLPEDPNAPSIDDFQGKPKVGKTQETVLHAVPATKHETAEMAMSKHIEETLKDYDRRPTPENKKALSEFIKQGYLKDVKVDDAGGITGKMDLASLRQPAPSGDFQVMGGGKLPPASAAAATPVGAGSMIMRNGPAKQRAIDMMKANPSYAQPSIMQQLGIRPEDLQ
jgi:hypothetical protein